MPVGKCVRMTKDDVRRTTRFESQPPFFATIVFIKSSENGTHVIMSCRRVTSGVARSDLSGSRPHLDRLAHGA